jgi:SAM-dependent methyltransferase
VTDFAAVDAGAARALVAMMDATDAWSAVCAARDWVLRQVALDGDAVVVDVGCGPGTFAASAPGLAVDLDVSAAMLRETRRRRATARAVLGDVTRLPVGDGRGSRESCRYGSPRGTPTTRTRPTDHLASPSTRSPARTPAICTRSPSAPGG